MSVIVTLEDIQAYTEVDYIIHHMNERYMNMVPVKLLNFFSKFKDPDYQVYVDPKKPLQNQGLKRYTLEIIAVLHVKYWCENEERRQDLLQRMKANQMAYDDALRAKYNVENIFANQTVTMVNDEFDLNGETVEMEDVSDFSRPQKANVLGADVQEEYVEPFQTVSEESVEQLPNYAEPDVQEAPNVENVDNVQNAEVYKQPEASAEPSADNSDTNTQSNEIAPKKMSIIEKILSFFRKKK